MADAIAVLNAGSSSLKFSVFVEAEPAHPPPGHAPAAAGQAPRVADKKAARDLPPSSSPLKFLFGGQAEALTTKPQFTARDSTGNVIETRPFADGSRGHDAAVELVLAWCDEHLEGHRLEAAGHRVVHGGTDFADPVLIDERVMEALAALVPLAPLHQPHNLAAIQAVAKLAPRLPQVACFDTAFHRTQPPLAQAFALPRTFADDGVRRYGFHGLSYEYVAGALAALDARAAAGRTVVAHLGNGASMCAMLGGRSVATTMGFTAVDGLVMGTRTGSLDPGVMLYLMSRYGMDHAALEDLLYHRSGLLGVSGVSSDVRTLLASRDPRASEALDLFVYRIGRELGSLAAALGGLDALVFTGGIGENAGAIRQRVCRDAAWLGVQLDDAANLQGEPRISRAGSTVSVWIVPTNEELMIARHTRRVLAHGPR